MGKYYRKYNNMYNNNHNYYQRYYYYSNFTSEISYHNEKYRRVGNGLLKIVNHCYIRTDGRFNFKRRLLTQGDELSEYNGKTPNFSYRYNYDRYNYRYNYDYHFYDRNNLAYRYQYKQFIRHY